MPRPPKPLINDDTLAVLRFLHRVRYADRDHVMAYCARRPIPPAKIGYGRESIRQDLVQLVHHQYLAASKWYAKRRNTEGYGGRDKMVYVLGQGGAAAIGKRWTDRHLNRLAKRGPFPSLMRHEMMIPNWHTWLLCGERTGVFTVSEVDGVRHSGAIAEPFVSRSGETVTLHLYPDQLVMLERDGRSFAIFLEAETGEKPVGHTLEHITKYATAWKHKLFERKYGIRDFCVVFLVKAEAATRNRIEAARSESPFARRVLFLPEERIDFDHPELLMEPIFERASGDFVPLVPSKVRDASATLKGPEDSTSSSFHGPLHARVS